MAGSPLKHERNRLVREAILLGIEDGTDPAQYVRKLIIEPVEDVLTDAEAPPAARIAAASFIADRIDGKAVQSVEVDSREHRDLFDAALLGTALELLKRLPERVRQEHLIHETEPAVIVSADTDASDRDV